MAVVVVVRQVTMERNEIEEEGWRRGKEWREGERNKEKRREERGGEDPPSISVKCLIQQKEVTLARKTKTAWLSPASLFVFLVSSSFYHRLTNNVGAIFGY